MTRDEIGCVLRELVELQRVLVAEVRGLRADLRRRADADAPTLVDALREFFGDGRFTVRGVLEATDEDQAIAEALSAAIDMNGAPRSRATMLGALLARLPDLEIVAQQRGCAVYRSRT
jgi:hypothetical protein